MKLESSFCFGVDPANELDGVACRKILTLKRAALRPRLYALWRTGCGPTWRVGWSCGGRRRLLQNGGRRVLAGASSWALDRDRLTCIRLWRNLRRLSWRRRRGWRCCWWVGVQLCPQQSRRKRVITHWIWRVLLRWRGRWRRGQLGRLGGRLAGCRLL